MSIPLTTARQNGHPGRPSAGQAAPAASLDLDVWVDRQPGAAPWTSNQEADAVPFQRWFRFKEAFSPRFVVEALTSLDFRPTSCLDPFGGSGTTALSCQFLGIRPSVIEVNPFLADLIEAKLTRYDLDALLTQRARLATAVAKLSVTPAPRSSKRRGGHVGPASAPLFPGAPDTFVEPGRDDRWIFDAVIAARIALYRAAIETLECDKARRLFRVLLGSVLVSVSNVVVSGKGRRYRAPSRQHAARAADVDLRFDDAFQRAYFDICRYSQRSQSEYTLLRGDARVRITDVEPVDVVLCSPPYPNSFDYTDIYNIELWALGYLGSARDNRVLREATLRSHVQIRGRFEAGTISSPTLTSALERLVDARARLWNPDIPAMVHAYFEDMSTVLAGARARLRGDRGRILLVVGDSRYAGVDVPVATIIRELAPTLGMRCLEARAVRSMRASAQQGGTYDLSESLLVLAPG